MAGEPNGGGSPSLTDAMKEEINDMLGSVVNNTMTARLKTFEKQLHEKIQASFGETLKTQLPELLKDFKPAASGENTEGKEGKGGKSKVDDVELQTLKRKLEEVSQRADTFEQRARDERENRRRGSMQQSVVEALSTHGITGAAAKGALALLMSENRIAFKDEDSDELVYRGDDGLAIDLPIGLRQWAKTEDAKIYLPSSGTRGSGSRPGGTAGGFTGGKVTKDQQVAILQDLLDRNL